VISTDGASQLTKTVATNVEQSMQMISDLTGVDIATMVGALASKATAPNAPLTTTASEPTPTPPED
jgi:flotillin